jgi:hypothetical protein
MFGSSFMAFVCGNVLMSMRNRNSKTRQAVCEYWQAGANKNPGAYTRGLCVNCYGQSSISVTRE